MRERGKILYLLVVALAIFLFRDVLALGVLLFLQLGLWAWVGLPPGQALRLLRKMGTLFFFVILSFALFPEEGLPARWFNIPLAAWTLRLSKPGMWEGLLMCLRIYTVIFTSLLVRRTSGEDEFVQGLRGLFVPEVVALTLDGTLHLLSPEERGGDGEGGHGSGGGRRRREGGGGFPLREILRGDVGFLIRRIESGLTRGRQYIERRYPGIDPQRARDLGVICGVTLTMVTIKWLKILPGLPFAPGHKTVVLLPLYLVAAELTRMRWGATVVGASVGILGFLMGDGRYGVFEIFKHLAPGVFIDLLLPLAQRHGARIPGAVRYGLVGLLAAFGRFATILLITILMGAPAGFYAVAAPLALVHLSFGAASGAVSYAVMQRLGQLRQAAGEEK